MLVQSTSSTVVTPQDLAHALFSATPEEFAAVWLEFNCLVDSTDESPLDAFAEHMAPTFGGNCQKPIVRLAQLIAFHREAGERKLRKKGGG